MYVFIDLVCLSVGYPCVWQLIIMRAASFEANQHDILSVEFILWIYKDKEVHPPQFIVVYCEYRRFVYNMSCLPCT
jgi:hypothetical protein